MEIANLEDLYISVSEFVANYFDHMGCLDERADLTQETFLKILTQRGNNLDHIDKTVVEQFANEVMESYRAKNPLPETDFAQTERNSRYLERERRLHIRAVAAYEELSRYSRLKNELDAWPRYGYISSLFLPSVLGNTCSVVGSITGGFLRPQRKLSWKYLSKEILRKMGMSEPDIQFLHEIYQLERELCQSAKVVDVE